MKTAFAFDLDGTVTAEELLPLLAKKINLAEEINFLTYLTINNIIPFEDSFKLRFAVLKSIQIEVIHSIVKSARLNTDIVEFIIKNRENCYIVTGNVDHWITPIIEFLGCGVFSSIAELEGNYCTKLTNIIKKSSAIEKLKRTYDQVVAIGEGANDLSMFEAADISICYGGVHDPSPKLYSHSQYMIFEGKKLCDLLNTLL